MLEQNTSRMMFCIGGILVIAILIGYTTANYEEVKAVLDQFFSFRLIKY